MRYTFAGLLIVLGLIAGGIGIAQKTVWAPSETIDATAQLDDPGSLVVVEPGVLNLYSTPATLTVEGEGEITVAQASKENVDAWVGSAAHTEITGVSSETALATKKVDGDAESAQVKGADLWEKETSGDGSVELEWDSDPARTAFLIGTDGKADAASSVTVSWPSHATTPWAIPLMILGGLLVIAGIVLGWITFLKGKKDSARRDARADRRKKLAETGTAFAILPVIALSACSPAELPKAEPSAAPSTPAASVTDEQIAKIVDDASTTVAAADKKTDAKALGARADGPFLEQRKDAYAVKKKDDSYDLPPALAADEITLNFTSQTDQWPRITTVVTTDAKTGQSQLLSLQQKDARADYKVWSQTVLLTGAEIPSVPDAREGAELLAPDATGFVTKPEDVVKNYADVLENPDDSKHKDKYANDAFRKQVKKAQDDLRSSLESGGASVEYDYDTKDTSIVAQKAADGSAVLTGYINVTTTISPEEEDGRVGTLKLSDPQASIVGEESTSKDIVTNNLQLVSFVLPKSGSKDKISLIGVSDAITGASLK